MLLVVCVGQNLENQDGPEPSVVLRAGGVKTHVPVLHLGDGLASCCFGCWDEFGGAAVDGC